jgi:hypothetical protein
MHDTNNMVFWGLIGSYSGNYGAPEGFCFDVYCADQDEQALVNKSEDVLQQRMQLFAQSLAMQANRTKGRNIMLTMGMNFFYSEADMNFRNVDLLIEAANQYFSADDGSINSTEIFGHRFNEVNVFYSTPSWYRKCKHNDFMRGRRRRGVKENDDAPPLPPTERKYDSGAWMDNMKARDFFPYADCDHCYWLSYLSSWQNLKRMECVGSSFLRAAWQIEVMMKLQSLVVSQYDDTTTELSWNSSSLYTLDSALGIAQHHDCVTGTSKQHVAYDYAKRISKGMRDASLFFVANGLRQLFIGQHTDFLQNLQLCHLLNETMCDVSQVSFEFGKLFPFQVQAQLNIFLCVRMHLSMIV